ncbi:MAG: hypothetical protein ACRCZU_09910, partial [Selenomonadaceae bacterium]
MAPKLRAARSSTASQKNLHHKEAKASRRLQYLCAAGTLRHTAATPLTHRRNDAPSDLFVQHSQRFFAVQSPHG